MDTSHKVSVPASESIVTLAPHIERAEVPVQDAIEAAIFEGEPPIQQMPENSFHPLIPQEDLQFERTHWEHLRSSCIQPDESNQLFQNFPSIQWVPVQAVTTDPMLNELIRVSKQDRLCTTKYELKKIVLQLECEQEIETIRRKYEDRLQEAEKEYLRKKNMIMEVVQKILLHKVFAEEVGSNFYDPKEGSSTFCQEQDLHHEMLQQATKTFSSGDEILPPGEN